MMTREQIVTRFEANKFAHQIGLTAEGVNKCLDRWEQPHRHYHSLSHLSDLLEQIDKYGGQYSSYKIEVAALFHDVIYDPKGNSNEELSIQFYRDICPSWSEEIVDIIRYTKYDNYEAFKSAPDFIQLFCHLDIRHLQSGNPTEIMQNELALLKEFQFVDYPTYRSKRLEFLENFHYIHPSFKQHTIEFVTNYRPKVGVYAGSFNPFHIGHMNVLEQAEKIFDKVIVAIGYNPQKSQEKFCWHPYEVLPYHETYRYGSLLPDYLKTLDYADVTLIRGLRNGYDLQYEMNQLRFLEDYECKVPVAYFVCNKEFAHISSSDLRGLSKFDNGDINRYKPNKYSYVP